MLQKTSSGAGARLAIRLLQDAAQRGDIDPWDVDVITVIDGFLDQLHQRISCPLQTSSGHHKTGGSYEKDLADTSEAFLAASVLVSLKAEILEADIFSAPTDFEETYDSEFPMEQGWLDPSLDIPRNPERLLSRRPVAPPPLKRSVSLGELIEQLESIAESLESEDFHRRRLKKKRFTDKEIIKQVSSLAHREKLPETTAALGKFLENWEQALHWVDFDLLVFDWAKFAPTDLDTDRVGVFWALLFLCSQGKIELHQKDTLYSQLTFKRILAPGTYAQLPINDIGMSSVGSAAA